MSCAGFAVVCGKSEGFLIVFLEIRRVVRANRTFQGVGFDADVELQGMTPGFWIRQCGRVLRTASWMLCTYEYFLMASPSRTHH